MDALNNLLEGHVLTFVALVVVVGGAVSMVLGNLDFAEYTRQVGIFVGGLGILGIGRGIAADRKRR